MKLQIWDSAGQERYKSLIPSYVRGASIICVVFDINSNIVNNIERETFESVPNWISFIKGVKSEDALIVLCGNKIDLER
jgi:GTPase SAR1 family protein